MNFLQRLSNKLGAKRKGNKIRNSFPLDSYSVLAKVVFQLFLIKSIKFANMLHVEHGAEILFSLPFPIKSRRAQ